MGWGWTFIRCYDEFLDDELEAISTSGSRVKGDDGSIDMNFKTRREKRGRVIRRLTASTQVLMLLQ